MPAELPEGAPFLSRRGDQDGRRSDQNTALDVECRTPPIA
ncbi:hypothetical protein SEA_SCHOTTB_85 [Gordonia Phage SchottB]|nr:hypothetical protein SEA_SCHOTTB_85 [Gordonia Phage SchottB]